MLCLTFSTGIIDALGYLGLDRVFTANMTGNVVILGMGLMGAEGLPVIGPLVAFGGFLVGATVTGRVLRQLTTGWAPRTTVVLTLVGLITFALGILLLLWGTPPSACLRGITGVLGMVMGAQAAAARTIGVKDITTVVITSTITGLAADSKLAGGTGKDNPRRVATIALMLTGAAAGALLLLWLGLGAGLVVAGCIVTVCALVGHVTGRDA
ncbi:YoaK family protein [Kocuria sp. JC486]|uniref:YoaK family protein n=1 Tax=Kocuria sp. JC486 TaxID=1970736 RepID=UPI001FD82474|nr:YoaK family protein [Kocuria sp. JC486]